MRKTKIYILVFLILISGLLVFQISSVSAYSGPIRAKVTLTKININKDYNPFGASKLSVFTMVQGTLNSNRVARGAQPCDNLKVNYGHTYNINKVIYNCIIDSTSKITIDFALSFYYHILFLVPVVVSESAEGRCYIKNLDDYQISEDGSLLIYSFRFIFQLTNNNIFYFQIEIFEI